MRNMKREKLFFRLGMLAILSASPAAFAQTAAAPATDAKSDAKVAVTADASGTKPTPEQIKGIIQDALAIGGFPYVPADKTAAAPAAPVTAITQTKDVPVTAAAPSTTTVVVTTAAPAAPAPVAAAPAPVLPAPVKITDIDSNELIKLGLSVGFNGNATLLRGTGPKFCYDQVQAGYATRTKEDQVNSDTDKLTETNLLSDASVVGQDFKFGSTDYATLTDCVNAHSKDAQIDLSTLKIGTNYIRDDEFAAASFIDSNGKTNHRKEDGVSDRVTLGLDSFKSKPCVDCTLKLGDRFKDNLQKASKLASDASLVKLSAEVKAAKSISDIKKAEGDLSDAAGLLDGKSLLLSDDDLKDAQASVLKLFYALVQKNEDAAKSDKSRKNLSARADLMGDIFLTMSKLSFLDGGDADSDTESTADADDTSERGSLKQLAADYAKSGKATKDDDGNRVTSLPGVKRLAWLTSLDPQNKEVVNANKQVTKQYIAAQSAENTDCSSLAYNTFSGPRNCSADQTKISDLQAYASASGLDQLASSSPQNPANRQYAQQQPNRMYPQQMNPQYGPQMYPQFMQQNGYSQNMMMQQNPMSMMMQAQYSNPWMMQQQQGMMNYPGSSSLPAAFPAPSMTGYNQQGYNQPGYNNSIQGSFNANAWYGVNSNPTVSQAFAPQYNMQNSQVMNLSSDPSLHLIQNQI